MNFSVTGGESWMMDFGEVSEAGNRTIVVRDF